MEKIRDLIRNISPILIKPDKTSLTIGISKRFFLFNLMKRLVNIIEEDPHLNFVAVLKSYKVLGKILTGTLHEFYRDRNRLYFKNFFHDRTLYEIVKADLEYLHPEFKDIKMTITKKGVIIYNNYDKHSFNVLLLTIHSGTWVPENIKKHHEITEKTRTREEDIDTHRIYCKLVLEKKGIWIDNKLSRFVIDFNRTIEGAIYDTYKDVEQKPVWTGELSKSQYADIFSAYREFYFTLARLIDTFSFNIIFDGHSMKDINNRPEISFGTRYIPKFYLPIVRSMQRKMSTMGYGRVFLNSPYGGGFILKWLSTQFPYAFVFSMEINKKLYMTKDRTRSIMPKVHKLSDDLINIFDIDLEEAFASVPERKDKATSSAKYLPKSI